jgi:P27 family predicted phage terminase small subunit
MGLRGPAPAPTAVKELRKTRPDRINHDEPKARLGLPDPPDSLRGLAREVWDYTIEELRVMRVMSPADRDALVAYCEAVATHRRASDLLASQDVLVDTPKGFVKNPLLQIQRDAATLMKQYAAEFGLTPRARSEIKMPKVGGVDEREDLLS